MDKPTTIPAYAAAIWTEGDLIKMSLPPSFHEEWGHTITFPNTEDAWLALNGILRERERAERESRVIGTRAAPVQYDADAILKKLVAERKAAEAAIAEGKVTVIPSVRKSKADETLTLEDLGL